MAWSHYLVRFWVDKVDKFKRADLGQLSFYVEALDRDVKKSHERPRSAALRDEGRRGRRVRARADHFAHLVAEYQTFLPPTEVLRAKLHELYAQLAPMEDAP